MTKEQEEARSREFADLMLEETEGKKKILASLGLPYELRNDRRDGEPRPPEIIAYERQIALKFKAIMDKYKE